MFITSSMQPRRPAFWTLAIAACSILATSIQASAAETAPNGLLFLHASAQNQSIAASLPALEKYGCGISLTGSVVDAAGTMQIDKPERFSWLHCEQPVLSSTEGRASIAALIKEGSGIIAIEGPVMARTIKLKDELHGTTPGIIIKLSRYKNNTPDQMAADLDELVTLANQRDKVWVNDAFIAPVTTIGMPSPDEAVMIHYPDIADGQHFRENNLDIMKLVGAFNKNHLIEYTYLSARMD